MIASIVASITTVLTFCSIFYFIAALWSARSFLRRRRPSADFAPNVSILKSLKGLDSGMYEAFASNCLQQYTGEYEILFGVSTLDDPAVAAVERLQAEFPNHSIRLIVCPEKLGLNGKVSNLAQMSTQARYEYLIVNDSDIYVSPRYLARIMAGFAAPERGKSVGMVTAPYRGIAHKTLGSKMEALGIATDFFPGVLTALKLDRGLRFGLGSTLAVSRPALAAAGGLTALVDSLADDYELGARISKAGYAIVLSHEVVATSVPPYRLCDFFAHQIRWARAVRDSRKLGYAGLVITFGIPWALLNFIASGFDLPSLALLSLAVSSRVALALAVGVGILDDRQVLRDLWLVPLRDFCALWVWIWSYAGNSIIWRGERFLLKNGKLTKPPAKPLPPNPV